MVAATMHSAANSAAPPAVSVKSAGIPNRAPSPFMSGAIGIKRSDDQRKSAEEGLVQFFQ